jgi:hypothetical protein
MCNCGSSIKKGFPLKGIGLLKNTPKSIVKKINPPRFNHLRLMSFKIK